ncbi:MAG: DUF4012 domain-containing protein [Lachnospiraceae bacterium]|nr:DUF4012 domain-containing protein [Lachnospiraceae bacterium]
MHKKKRIKPIFIILPIVIVLLALISIPIAKVSITKNQASNLKDSLIYFLDCVKNKDSEGAEKALADTREKTDTLNDTLNDGFWKTARKVSFVDRELDVADELLTIVYDVEDNLLSPLVEKMKKYPLTDLKVGDGFNTKLMNVYLDFLEEKQPYLEEILGKINSIDTDSFVGGFLGEKKDSIYKAVDAYHEASALLPFLRVFIGDGSDRLYLLAAQNSAEIRASGGFPGSIGTIKIKDGVLTIGDFASVYYVLDGSISYKSGLDSSDYIFGTWIDAPRDACFIPDFKKVGQVWAVAYQDYQLAHPEGNEEYYYDYDYFYDDSEEETVSDNTEAPEDEDVIGEILSNKIDYVIDRTFLVGDPEVDEPDGEEPGGEEPGGEEPGGKEPGGKEPGAETDPEKEKNTGKTEYDFEYGGIMYTGIYDGVNYDYSTDEEPYHVDGVVSLTPAIIQMLLKDIGEVQLFDGTVLNGENATRILQHEIYIKYYCKDSFDDNSGYFADTLFAETAKKVMKEFVSNFEISKFADYYQLFKDGAEQKIINVWMSNPEEQKIVEEIGISGKLNDDPENPVAGVYFSLADASKLGWYVDIIPEISEPVINADNSRTYDVKITLNNMMSDEEQRKINWYIIGTYDGDIRSFIHCFAPAGGTITDVETSNGMYMLEDEYHGLQVAYNLDVLIGRGNPIEITYKITTAPGVETPLKVVTTPTLTQYRLPEDYGPITGENVVD